MSGAFDPDEYLLNEARNKDLLAAELEQQNDASLRQRIADFRQEAQNLRYEYKSRKRKIQP